MSGNARRSRCVIYAEVDPDVADWLDGLPPPGPKEKPNRSFHIRQALELYRRGGVAKTTRLLERLEKEREQREPTPIELAGEWWSSLPVEVRTVTWRVAEALRRFGPDRLPPAELGGLSRRRKASDKS